MIREHIHQYRERGGNLGQEGITPRSRKHVGETSGGYDVFGPDVTKWHNVHGKEAQELVASLKADGKSARIFEVMDRFAIDNPDSSLNGRFPVISAYHEHN
jgi:hypothetical protein